MKRFFVFDPPLAGCIVVAGSLAACGGSQQQQIAVPSTANAVVESSSHQQVFNYTGSAQSFVVPKGVTQLKVIASGASGPIVVASSCSRNSGKGGVVHATIPVTAGETLGIIVGGQGDEGYGCGSQYGDAKGGFNGGGDGGQGSYFYHGYYDNWAGNGGGGASDVRQGGSALSNRVVVAAGGGGSGGFPSGAGGIGGGLMGGIGHRPLGHAGYCAGWAGRGATQQTGGQGGRAGPHRGAGASGTLGIGGGGGTGTGGGGGGAGGGYYGGGGGGSGDHYHKRCRNDSGGGGGGGGSSYVEPKATDVKNQRGSASPGNGKITLSW